MIESFGEGLVVPDLQLAVAPSCLDRAKGK